MQQILDSSKLKEFADDYVKFDENASPKEKKTPWEKETLLVTSNVSFSHPQCFQKYCTADA